MAHSRYGEARGAQDSEGAEGAQGAGDAQGPSVLHVVNSSAEAQEVMRRWRASDDDSPQY